MGSCAISYQKVVLGLRAPRDQIVKFYAPDIKVDQSIVADAFGQKAFDESLF